MKTATVALIICQFFVLTWTKGPIVINTWPFKSAGEKAWDVIQNTDRTAIDAIVEGCSVCEREQCDGTVGYGGSPDENSDVALDALLIDGKTMNVGAVASMRSIKNAIGVARHVLDNTAHSLLVGEQATEFAVMMGFARELLNTTRSQQLWQEWKDNRCQPNFWRDVEPDAGRFCGPYSPTQANNIYNYMQRSEFNSNNHDTIGMVAIDTHGNIAGGTSTNGARYKIPGRVGDSPIAGSGAYAVNGIGAAAATGDGDIMMRFLPSFFAIECLRNGKSPNEAAQMAIGRIREYHPRFFGGIVVLHASGEYGAACSSVENGFQFTVASANGGVRIEKVACQK